MHIFNRYEFRFVANLVLLFACLCLGAYALIHTDYSILLISIIIVIVQVIRIVDFLNKSNEELAKFIDAVQYRDFSLLFNEKKAPLSVKHLRKAFNTINQTFKSLSSERESQYQYLQKILEIVDTGILSYNSKGDIKWMNESLKKILNVPYLKNINAISNRNEELLQVIFNLKVGNNEMIKLNNKQVLLAKTSFIENKETFELVAFQNINDAIDMAENQAWQKLLRVMTHEIMNSVAPIASLADTLQNRITNKETDWQDDVKTGMTVIKKRSEGLLKFAEVYRNFSKITTASFAKVPVHELFDNIETLMDAAIQAKGVALDVILKEPFLEMTADLNLIEQVLINLIINALEAVKDVENKLITLSAFGLDNGKVQIEVRDNGAGIADDILEQIFVPFFTTKKSGSGVGLSLSKQILALHKGSITVKSVVGQGTVFILTL